MKLVHARVLAPQARGARVFESEKDAVVEPDENRYVTLVIHNCSLTLYCLYIVVYYTVRLEEDHILGCSHRIANTIFR